MNPRNVQVAPKGEGNMSKVSQGCDPRRHAWGCLCTPRGVYEACKVMLLELLLSSSLSWLLSLSNHAGRPNIFVPGNKQLQLV